MKPVNFKKVYLLSSERYDSLRAQANLNRNEPQKILQSLGVTLASRRLKMSVKAIPTKNLKLYLLKQTYPR